MSYFADQHSHSLYSFDSKNRIEDMLARAKELGLNELSVTDHLDLNSHPLLYSLQPPYESEKAFSELCRFRDSTDIKLTVGIELGQSHDCPDAAKAILKKNDYDQVIGSLHNLRGMPDFYFHAYGKMTKEQAELFFNQYLNELEEIVDHGLFDSLAHLTYPIRYMMEGGHRISVEPFIPHITEIFKKLIANEKALEVNSSGYRQGLDGPLPDYELLRLYYDLGGRYITVGSDAHRLEHIGYGIPECYENLKKIGFKHICSFTQRKMTLREI